MDNFIEADFIGGIWDGKTYAIPIVPEWQVAILEPPSWIPELTTECSPRLDYDVAVYKNIGHGIFWLSRIEKK